MSKATSSWNTGDHTGYATHRKQINAVVVDLSVTISSTAPNELIWPYLRAIVPSSASNKQDTPYTTIVHNGCLAIKTNDKHIVTTRTYPIWFGMYHSTSLAVTADI